MPDGPHRRRGAAPASIARGRHLLRRADRQDFARDLLEIRRGIESDERHGVGLGGMAVRIDIAESPAAPRARSGYWR